MARSVLLCLLLSSTLATAESLRQWTDAKGRIMQAELLGVTGDSATFRMATGQQMQFPIAQLSPADQATAKAFKPAAPANNAPAPIGQRTWPGEIEVPAKSIEITVVEENAEQKRYVYQSEAFSFTAEDKLAPSVMKEIARTFEASRTLAKALPWGLDPKPGPKRDHFQAMFFESRDSYIAAGGPANSGGVYMSKDRIFRIPFPSLGLERRGKTWYKDENYTNDTVIHEITHQMMHEYLTFLPKWVIEGSAEYAELLPYRAGRFLCSSHERGFKEHFEEQKRRGLNLAELGDLAAHMKVTRDEWEAGSIGGRLRGISNQGLLYARSAVLVYYFCHLDGDGKGTRFLQFLDKISQARSAWNTFFSNPKVKYNADTGEYRYPGDMKLPDAPMTDEYGLSLMPMLMADRSSAQLNEEINAALRKIGIR
jgi:hypothetical protein